jgi:predicted nuclease with RNAse H fold
MLDGVEAALNFGLEDPSFKRSSLIYDGGTELRLSTPLLPLDARPFTACSGRSMSVVERFMPIKASAQRKLRHSPKYHAQKAACS